MGTVRDLQNFNAASFRAIAQSFDRTRHKPWRDVAPLVEDVAEGEEILDLGCGNGRLLDALPPVNFQYTGLDSNEYLTSQARKRWPGKKFIQASFETMQLEPEYFDRVYLIASFHHVPGEEERLAVLRKCYATLKPGGKLLLTVWNLWQPRYFRYIVKNWHLKIKWNDFFIPWKESYGVIWRYYHGFTKTELQRVLNDAGFKNIEFLESVAMGRRLRKNYVVRAVK